jgi:uncharacterized membrane protein YozB (DUF420 family)
MRAELTSRPLRIARWTWPLWMHASATGAIIALLPCQIFPQL